MIMRTLENIKKSQMIKKRGPGTLRISSVEGACHKNKLNRKLRSINGIWKKTFV